MRALGLRKPAFSRCVGKLLCTLHARRTEKDDEIVAGGSEFSSFVAESSPGRESRRGSAFRLKEHGVRVYSR